MATEYLVNKLPTEVFKVKIKVGMIIFFSLLSRIFKGSRTRKNVGQEFFVVVSDRLSRPRTKKHVIREDAASGRKLF